jgi:hypothetical protein
VPPGLGFGVEDLIDARTAQSIAYGGQLSDLVNLGVHVRVLSAGAVSVAGQPVARPQVTPCERSPGCAAVAERWQTFERHSANLLGDVGDPAPTRGTVDT